MNRRRLLIAAIVIVTLALTNKNFRNKILPNGKMTRDDTLGTETSVTPQPIPGRPQVEISTAKGKFTVELRPDLAPKTVTNYLAKWNSDFCNGKTIHRVEDWVVQGCDPKGDGTGGNDSLPTETSSEPFTTGSLGVARRPFPKDVSNDSQFFVVKKDSTFLNGEYTYFGRVISGMDTINRLAIGDKILTTTILGK